MKPYPNVMKSLIITSLCITVGCSPAPVKEEAAISRPEPKQTTSAGEAAETVADVVADKQQMSAGSVEMSYGGSLQHRSLSASPAPAVMMAK